MGNNPAQSQNIILNKNNNSLNQVSSVKKSIQRSSQNLPRNLIDQKFIQSIKKCYRIIFIEPNSVINKQISNHKLNIMTDYIINKDPKLNIIQEFKKLLSQYKKIKQKGKQKQEDNNIMIMDKLNLHLIFQVFSILDYTVRQVIISIPIIVNQSAKQQQNIILPNIGVKFQPYQKINDCILRISKIFKNSPLQKYQIQVNDYIVGLLQCNFTSIKQFINKIKELIESNYQVIHLCICNLNGETRVIKLLIKDLTEYKRQYTVGYLGCQLAQGWLNKWELKKNIQDKNRRASQPSGKNTLKLQQHITQLKIQTFNKSGQVKQKIQQVEIRQKQVEIIQIKQQQLLIKETILKKQIENKSTQEKNKQQQKLKKSDISEKSVELTTKIVEETQKKQLNQQYQSSISSVTSSQIQQKCSQLRSNIYHVSDPVSNSLLNLQTISQQNSQKNLAYKYKKNSFTTNKSQIIEIRYKGILKNQLIDDASTICKCQNYSKHCQKCFIQKQGNYYFFNKKINKIVIIEKNMLFPKILI